jgi:hypothetical protein
MPLWTTSMPLSARIVSNRAGHLPSRSRMMCRAADPASWRSMARLRATWVTQAAVGWAGRGAEDADAAGGVFDDRQDVYPGAGQRHRFDEVHSQQRVGL